MYSPMYTQAIILLCLRIYVGCSFLSVTTTYTEYGSGYVVPSAAAKAGLEIMTR